MNCLKLAVGSPSPTSLTGDVERISDASLGRSRTFTAATPGQLTLAWTLTRMARPRSEDKRNAILAAAVQVIARQGTSALTSQIAKIAGIAEGSLFTYFVSKVRAPRNGAPARRNSWTRSISARSRAGTKRWPE
jgi:Bacterial regulatory proteins, tetR family